MGDCLPERHFAGGQDPDFLALVHLLRGTHCAWGNCETVIADPGTVYRAAKPTDPHCLCEPWGADELGFLGLRLMGTANNHTMDFGIRGMGSTLTNLQRVGIAHAGAGLELAQAALPGYLDTAAGSVALVNCASTFLDYFAAGSRSSVYQGRPGLNPLHLSHIVEVEPALFEKLDRAQEDIQDLLAWNDCPEVLKQLAALRPAGTALFFDTFVKAGEKIEIVSQPHPEDVSRIHRAIQVARRKARVVIAAVHSHEARRRLEEPAPFLPVFARSCLDTGADACFVTGPHVLRGIEIYHGKPIFYSLGNFIAHFTLDTSPSPADGGETASILRERRFWETFVPRVTFAAGGETAAIDLYPITLGFDGPVCDRGNPRLARGGEARAILHRLVELSRPYGTEIELDGEIGRVRLG